MVLTDKEQAREFEHNRKVQNEALNKVEEKEKEIEDMAMGYGIELQSLYDKIEDLKEQINNEREKNKGLSKKFETTLKRLISKIKKRYSNQITEGTWEGVRGTISGELKREQTICSSE